MRLAIGLLLLLACGGASAAEPDAGSYHYRIRHAVFGDIGAHEVTVGREAGRLVTKDRFIVGRGKQSSDMTIKDPNVSRQHAMVEFLNGQYYMVDMGSTNGVEYNGQRIARKAIAEGDLFRICDHEIRFSYR